MGIEPEDFLNPANTVYKYEQIITREDLLNTLEHLLIEHAHIPHERILERACIEASAKTVDMLITWLDSKKPRNYEGMI